MTITEILQFVDRVVEKETGEHLDDLEKAVVKGLWQDKTYSEIADECGYKSKNYIGDVSRKLFKILSEHLKEDISRHNFSWTIERVINSQFVGLVNSKINWCPNSPQADANQSIKEKPSKNKGYHDLSLAPKITSFYDRATEVQTLTRWLIDQNVHLVSVLGLSGIGKTTLVKQFVDLNLQKFDVVIWKNLKISQSLDDIINEIITGVDRDSLQTDNKLTQFFNLLRQQRCLIVLDDFQELFSKGELAGEFKTESKNFQNLLTMMTNLEHQSSLILISQEQCQEMISLDEDLYPIQCLELQGLDNTEIVKKWGFKDDEAWTELSDLYGGNPVYLKDIASLIKSIFGGKVADFLKEDSLVVTKDMKSRLTELFKRLSSTEQEIILQLSKFDVPVSREDLRQSLSLSSMDLMNGLRSLGQRYLLQRIEGEKVLFDLSLVVREYVRTCCQD
ncbi:MAG: NB-ARC domain-containing protein [Tychonema bourrellyi B0820]|uniref:ATPase domain-containing protein n=1 Tax=Tychonema bourrellyi FEM_GT703 TaxID=2040638 RepID=A0A2G4EZ71_9CYAN|nr:NB-ARC domain-containing protein [Tychonema bourrellyi]MDQ2099931.1 NB-ARC domain-containing protein [Tychonema bourrellyi B0820]PHX54809.1 ATPase domain-containing protein [Tychonema bourrellyi FEM_GT703]